MRLPVFFLSEFATLRKEEDFKLHAYFKHSDYENELEYLWMGYRTLYIYFETESLYWK